MYFVKYLLKSRNIPCIDLTYKLNKMSKLYNQSLPFFLICALEVTSNLILNYTLF